MEGSARVGPFVHRILIRNVSAETFNSSSTGGKPAGKDLSQLHDTPGAQRALNLSYLVALHISRRFVYGGADEAGSVGPRTLLRGPAQQVSETSNIKPFIRVA
jgi:hypothetical protein